MKRSGLVIVLLLMGISLVGCGSSSSPHEKATSDMISTIEKMASVLNGIKTPDDAQKANAELKALCEKMDALNKEMENLNAPDEETDKMLQEKYSDKLAAAIKNLNDAFGKVGFVNSMKLDKDVRSQISQIMKSGH